MKVAFLNPQGNFDPADSYWTEHPDFGGQLVYVKEVAIAMAELGHDVDIITRQIIDPAWPEFAARLDSYPGAPRVRIVRIPCGPPHFLRKEDLWPYLGTEWAPGILEFYASAGEALPDAFTTHYADGGLAGALLHQQTGIPFTLTGHSLGAQKLDKLHPTPANLEEIDRRFHFSKRIAAERVAMNLAATVVVSTSQERMEQYSHPAYGGAVDVHDDAHFAVIPPGVNLRIFDFSARNSREEATQAHIERVFERDFAADRRHLPVVLSSSRLDAKKNHVGLVRAYAESAELQAVANLAFVVRGMEDPLRHHGSAQGEERAILEEILGIVDAHDLWGQVSSFPLSGQEELAAAYRYLAQRRSVFCLTALYEPFGLAPLEAIAAGLPAVVTQNGGPSESLYDAASGVEYGVLVDPADAADIARGLIKAIADPDRWRYYQRAGIQRVYDKYTWQRTAEGYLQVLERFTAGAGREAGVAAQEPIPSYFLQPEAHAITLDRLAAAYLGEAG